MPSLEALSTIATYAQLLIVIGTAWAGLAQIRHMSSKNDVDALFAIKHDFSTTEMQSALAYVQTELKARLEDPAYRAELARPGFVDPTRHPEMIVLNWFADMGTLVQNETVRARLFLELYGRLTIYYWDVLKPAIALLRRRRGDGQYENFEFLTLQAREWHARTGGAHSRARLRGRLPLDDTYLEEDRRAALALQAPAATAERDRT